MALNNPIIWIAFIWIFISGEAKSETRPYMCPSNNDNQFCKRRITLNCSKHEVAHVIKPNVSNSIFMAANFSQAFCNCKTTPGFDSAIAVKTSTFKRWKIPEVKNKNGSVLLQLYKFHTKRDLTIFVLTGTNCCKMVNQTRDLLLGNCAEDCDEKAPTDSCSMCCLETNRCASAVYDELTCSNLNENKYFVNATEKKCINCNNPVKTPEVKMNLTNMITNLPENLPANAGEPLNSVIAVQVMNSMTSDFVDQFNESTVALTLGVSVTGVLMKQIDPRSVEEVSFGYANITNDFSIVEDRSLANTFSRSITVSKEAFEKAEDLNISQTFASVFRFLNMSKDVYNSTVLCDEVIGIEMGAQIRNLTDKISINFRNMQYEGIPSCYSWMGNENHPVWSSDGCETLIKGPNITCSCTHLTFFAILLTPLNETISASHLNTLTTITRVGCGISMFFLGIVLFMHFVMRRARSSNSIKLLIHLVLAMFLLDFAFLVNDSVAKTKNVIGCKAMAAVMHYFMLSTFTWFSVHAFHLCLQLYHGGRIVIRRYVLKVSLVSWVMPSIIGIVLLSVGKYGEVVINTGDDTTSVAMCWILDNEVHYIVNIGYYALVFIFTFSTFILMLTWLFCVSRNQKVAAQGNQLSSSQRIVSIMGLCCVLGVTWGCAFFAYGNFRIPAYYCFTILNSFQGFCLFIYYYKTSRIVEAKDSHNSSSSSTLKTDLDEIFNPYVNHIPKPKPE